MKMINKIANETDWEKKWSVSSFSLLSCSAMSKYYHFSVLKRFKLGLSHNLFIYNKPTITCYQSATENSKFGQLIAKKIKTNKNFLNSLCTELIYKTDEIYKNFKKPLPNFLDYKNFQKLEKQLEEYLPAFVSVSRSANFLQGKQLRKLTKVRLYTENLYEELDAFFLKLLKLIAKTEKLNFSIIRELYFEELIQYIKIGKLPAKSSLQNRTPKSALYSPMGNPKYLSIQTGKLIEQAITKKSGLTLGIAKGNCAYPGVIYGTVRIIHNAKAFKTFNKGDVLVTGMTRPDFVPLMKKAGAVITDAGGILSHAAIVSRELKTPCIIGTKTATKAFKNGDLVEVDAKKGIIKKIK